MKIEFIKLSIMKKFMFLFICELFFISEIFGQLNPIKNLVFKQQHVMFSTCPGFNCIELTWNQPDISVNDNLVGYNIYRNDILWRFQTDIGFFCNEIGCPNSNDDFLNYGGPFTIKVKAVYNYNHIESIANGSAYFVGLSTEIKGNLFDKIFIMKNPVAKDDEICISIPDNLNEDFNIQIISILGQCINRINMNRENNIIKIKTNNFNSGIYQIILSFKNQSISRKIIVS
jgi:Secretion system C-terminal sorting domain